MSALLVPALFILAAGPVLAGDYVRVTGGEFRSVLDYEDTGGTVHVAPFELMVEPVTNAEYLLFVTDHPEWRRDRVATVFAEPRYLSHLADAAAFGDTAGVQQPVVQVSWFAASAYCEAQDARLPTWAEWEFASAADETRADARADPAWRERILSWYSRPSTAPLAEVRQTAANAWGVRDLHGLVWEWVEDYSAMLVSADNREQSDPDRLRFCGAGALSMNDRDHYAILMRVAMLSSLEAADTTGNLGFRCARDFAEAAP